MHFGDHEKEIYPEIDHIKVERALKWLSGIDSGEIHSINIDRTEAKKLIKELNSGNLPVYSVEGFAANYLDLMNKDKED